MFVPRFHTRMQMSTFCVTGDRRNVEAAVSMLKRLIMEGNSEVQANNNVNGHNANGLPGNINGNINGHINGNINGIINGNNNGDRRGGPVGIRGSAPGPGDVGQRMGRIGSDVMVSRNEKSPRTAPCRSVFLPSFFPSFLFSDDTIDLFVVITYSILYSIL